MRIKDIVLLLAVLALGAFIYLRRNSGWNGRALPPVDHLRLTGELEPLKRDWTALDAKATALRPGARADWPGLIQEAMQLLEKSALVNQHFAQDMSRLNGIQDPSTGVSHAEFVERNYGYVDSLGRCVLQLGGLIYSLHRTVDDPDPKLSLEYRRKAADYARMRNICLSGRG